MFGCKGARISYPLERDLVYTRGVSRPRGLLEGKLRWVVQGWVYGRVNFALLCLLHLWRLRVVDGRVGCLHSRSIEQLYPLSPFQKAILQDIVNSLAQRQRFLDQSAEDVSPSSSNWCKFRLLLGKPWYWKVAGSDPGHTSCHSTGMRHSLGSPSCTACPGLSSTLRSGPTR